MWPLEPVPGIAKLIIWAAKINAAKTPISGTLRSSASRANLPDPWAIKPDETSHIAPPTAGDINEEAGQSVMNPHSLVSLKQAMMEPSLANAATGTRYQFLRQGYFCVDPDSRPGALVFNRIVSLRDSWAKAQNA